MVGESTGESGINLVISDFSQPRSLPLHVDESAFVRHQIPADLDGNGSEESLLIQGVISRPDPTIAGAYQERPLLLLKEINDGVNQIIGGVLTQDNAKALVAQQGRDVVIPEGVTSIDVDAFRNTYLSTVVLPSTLKTIGNGAFQNTQLGEVVIPDGVTLIGVGAFSNTKLSNIVLPRTLNSIGKNAFTHTHLNTVVTPESAGIGAGAFGSDSLILRLFRCFRCQTKP